MKKFFLPIIVIVLMMLASCSKNSVEFVDPLPDDSRYPSDALEPGEGNNSSNSSNTSTTPDYKNPTSNIIDNNNPSIVTPVEQTVDKVYDCVVSILVSATTFSASGSGVLFSYDANLNLSYIVTCFHVIDGATNMNVKLANGNEYKASLVGGYEDQDLAVLSIEAKDLCYASFYTDSDSLKLGSQVVCIGNPLGTLPGSVSSGYLSYVNREISVDAYTKMSLLQTDVAINSGNSGGGLFNTSGALIGIVNAKYTDESIEGLGFAIPINTVKDVINSIIATARYDVNNKVWSEGYYQGDWCLGFTISDGYYRPNGYFGPSTYVIYVSSLSTNQSTSGDDAFEKDDLITAVKIDYKDEAKADIESLSIKSASSLLTDIYSAGLSIGDSIIFTITRDDVSQTVTVTLEQYIYSI